MIDAVDALLFDMDGVLVDSSPIHAAAYRDAFAELGVAFALERFEREFAGTPRAEVVAAVLGPNATDSAREHAFTRKGELAAEALVAHGAPAYAGVEALLSAARAHGLKLALVTTSRDPWSFIGAHLWSAWFDVVVNGEDVTQPKPAPQPYLLAMEKLGVRPERCMAFEDSPRGVQSATGAGARTWAVSTTNTSEALLSAGAEVVVDDLEALRARLFCTK